MLYDIININDKVEEYSIFDNYLITLFMNNNILYINKIDLMKRKTVSNLKILINDDLLISNKIYYKLFKNYIYLEHNETFLYKYELDFKNTEIRYPSHFSDIYVYKELINGNILTFLINKDNRYFVLDVNDKLLFKFCVSDDIMKVNDYIYIPKNFKIRRVDDIFIFYTDLQYTTYNIKTDEFITNTCVENYKIIDNDKILINNNIINVITSQSYNKPSELNSFFYFDYQNNKYYIDNDNKKMYIDYEKSNYSENNEQLIKIGTDKNYVYLSKNYLINNSEYIKSIFDSLNDIPDELIHECYNNIDIYKSFLINDYDINNVSNIIKLFKILNFMMDSNINYISELIVFNFDKYTLDECFTFLELMSTSVCDNQLNVLLYKVINKYKEVDVYEKIYNVKGTILYNFIINEIFKTVSIKYNTQT